MNTFPTSTTNVSRSHECMNTCPTSTTNVSRSHECINTCPTSTTNVLGSQEWLKVEATSGNKANPTILMELASKNKKVNWILLQHIQINNAIFILNF